MKIAIAQINTTVGDLTGNIRRILDAAEKAREVDLLVFPEMTVPGYPPRDMLYDASFVEAVQAATVDLARQSKDLPPLLVGSFKPAGEKHYQHPSLHNIAYLMKDDLAGLSIIALFILALITLGSSIINGATLMMNSALTLALTLQVSRLTE